MHMVKAYIVTHREFSYFSENTKYIKANIWGILGVFISMKV